MKTDEKQTVYDLSGHNLIEATFKVKEEKKAVQKGLDRKRIL